MHGLAVCGNHLHIVALDGHLSRAHRGEGVDHAESIATTGRNGKYLKRRVSHEASVRITELSLAVNQHGLGILAGVDSQTARITLCSILVQPIADEHYVCGQVEVVQMRVGIPRWWLSHNDAAVQTVQLLQAGVSVPEVGARIARPLITERVALLDGALCDEGHAIVVLRATLPDAMPVNGHLHALHMVLHINDDLVVFTHLYAGPGYHAIRCQDATLNAIGQDALTVTPNGVRCIGRAHLAGTVNRR